MEYSIASFPTDIFLICIYGFSYPHTPILYTNNNEYLTYMVLIENDLFSINISQFSEGNK